MNNDFQFDSLIKKMAADHQAELPSPGVIWWRAQILKKQAERERVERPFTIMHGLAAVLCLVVAVSLWISQADGITGRAVGYPFVSILVFGVVIGVGCIGLLWWKAREV